MNQLNFVTRDGKPFVATWDDFARSWNVVIGGTRPWLNVTSKMLNGLIRHYTQTVTQTDVNRFLDVSFFMAPMRTYSQRMTDLLWRFPETPAAELETLSTNWELRNPLPVVQAEIAPTERLCNECGSVLDASKQHCAECGNQWSVF